MGNEMVNGAYNNPNGVSGGIAKQTKMLMRDRLVNALELSKNICDVLGASYLDEPSEKRPTPPSVVEITNDMLDVLNNRLQTILSEVKGL